MAEYTDAHDYTIDSESTPWRMTAGAVAVESGNILFPTNIAMERVSALAGNWIWDFELEIDPVEGSTSFGVGVGVAAASGFLAGAYRYPGVFVDELAVNANLRGMNFGVRAATAFGLYGPTPIPYAFPGIAAYRFYCQPSKNRVACLIVIDGIRYRSGWVTWPSEVVSSYAQPAIYTAPGADGYFASAGAFQFEDELTDEEIETLELDGSGVGAPSIPLPTASGSGTASHRGTGAPTAPLMTASGLGLMLRGPRSFVLPAATARISHVRILRGERTPLQAETFHNLMRDRG